MSYLLFFIIPDILDILRDGVPLDCNVFDELSKTDTSPVPLQKMTVGVSPVICNAVNKPCMDNPFFEEFVDLDSTRLFSDLEEMELNMGEVFCPFSLPEIYLADTQATAVDVGASEGATESKSLSAECDVTEAIIKEPVVLKEEVTVIETSDTILSPNPLPVSDNVVDILSVNSENEEQPVNGNTIANFEELFQIFASSETSSENGDTDSCDQGLLMVASPVSTCSNNSDIASSPGIKRCACELNDEPSAKKKRESLSDNDKIVQRRIKNNIASKYSRASRKSREKELYDQEKKLEKENAELKQEIENLTKLTQDLRQFLVQKLSTRC